MKDTKIKTYAKNCKCSDCDKQAVAFFPVCDPDIPEYPYCRECLDKRKESLMQEILKLSGGKIQ